jgi:hypothetical protein
MRLSGSAIDELELKIQQGDGMSDLGFQIVVILILIIWCLN